MVSGGWYKIHSAKVGTWLRDAVLLCYNEIDL